MPLTYVQQVTSLSITPTAGNALVLWVIGTNNSAGLSISDGKNIWVVPGSPIPYVQGNYAMWCAYALNVAGGLTTVTLSWTTGGMKGEISAPVIVEYSGLLAFIGVNATLDNGPGTGTDAINSGTISIGSGQVPAAVVGLVVDTTSNSNPINAGTGFNLRSPAGLPWTVFGGYPEDSISTINTAGSYAATWTAFSAGQYDGYWPMAMAFSLQTSSQPIRMYANGYFQANQFVEGGTQLSAFPAGWEYIGPCTITNNGATNPTVSAFPAGMQTGDLIVIGQRLYNISQTLVTPTSGGTPYTVLYAPQNYQAVYARYATGGEPLPTIDNTQFLWVSAFVIRAINGSAPAIGSVVDNTNQAVIGSDNNLGYPSLTPTQNDCFCLMFSCMSGTTGCTGVSDDVSNYPNHIYSGFLGGGHPAAVLMDYVIQTANNTIPAGNATLTGVTGASIIGITMSLAPPQPSLPYILSKFYANGTVQLIEMAENTQQIRLYGANGTMQCNTFYEI